MFTWDIVADNIFEQFLDWIYGQVINFLSTFFGMINSMGAEIFDLPWVEGILLFFSYLGWSLYAVGLVIAAFDVAIEAQSGKASLRDLSINAIKGFMAVNLFTTAPVELYKLSVTLQVQLGGALSGLSSTPDSISTLGLAIISNLILPAGGALLMLFIVIIIGYSIIKVLFDNLKRGGILLIMIAVGSLHMFSVTRGYMDGFLQWAKQIIALCVTAFLQSIVLIAGLLTFNDSMLLGLGLVMSATEVPRIAQQFGLESGTKVNFMSSIYTVQSLVNMGKNIVGAVGKVVA